MRPLSRCRLDAPPLNRYRKGTPPAPSCRSPPRASKEIASRYTLRRLGASSQPCLTSHGDAEGLRSVWSSRHRSYSTRMEGKKHRGENWWTTKLTNYWQKRLSVHGVNAFCRSINAMLMGTICSLLFSSSCQQTNILSTMLLSALKQHWDSGKRFLAMCLLKRARRIFAKRLLATSKRERLRWFEHSYLSFLF